MEGIFQSMLRATGGYDDITKAMDSDDLADVVHAATGAMQKALTFPMRISERKSKDESIRHRQVGNLHYANGDHNEAIWFYNKALAYAPNDSIEVKLAYSNLSAVMLTVGAHQPCQLNIKACQENGCPKDLVEKLNKRMAKATEFATEEMLHDKLFSTERRFIREFYSVKVNPEVQCASEDVEIVTNGSMKAVAAREIKAGTIVALERAFVSALKDEFKYSACYYCHKLCLFFIPCEGCSHALFCDKVCRERCWDDYHRVECKIVEFMGTMYIKPLCKLMTRAAIRISLKLGWDKLRTVSKEMGTKRLKKSTVEEAFDAGNPLSMLCFDDDKPAYPGKIFNGSTICAAAVHCLSRVPGYFPEAPNKRKEAIASISRIMLHLYSKFTNRIEMLCSALDVKVGTYKCGAQRNVGWFSFASKLPHSCEPNLLVLGLNDHIALIALQPIKKGEELTISYTDHYYDLKMEMGRHIRQQRILAGINYQCECRVCVQEWSSKYPIIRHKLSTKQNNVYRQLITAIDTGTTEDRLKASSAALHAFHGLQNTAQHRAAYNEFRSSLNLVQCANDQNKTYGVEMEQIMID